MSNKKKDKPKVVKKSTEKKTVKKPIEPKIRIIPEFGTNDKDSQPED